MARTAAAKLAKMEMQPNPGSTQPEAEQQRPMYAAQTHR